MKARYLSAYLITTVAESHYNETVINSLSEIKKKDNLINYKEFTATGKLKDAMLAVNSAIDFSIAVLGGKPCNMEFSDGTKETECIVDNLKMWKISNYGEYHDGLWIRKKDGTIITTGMMSGYRIYDYEKVPGADSLVITYEDNTSQYVGTLNLAQGNFTALDIHESIMEKLQIDSSNSDGKLSVGESTFEITKWIDDHTFEFRYKSPEHGYNITGTFDTKNLEVLNDSENLKITNAEILK